MLQKLLLQKISQKYNQKNALTLFHVTPIFQFNTKGLIILWILRPHFQISATFQPYIKDVSTLVIFALCFQHLQLLMTLCITAETKARRKKILLFLNVILNILLRVSFSPAGIKVSCQYQLLIVIIGFLGSGSLVFVLSVFWTSRLREGYQ